MKISKKVLSFALSVAMVIGMLTVTPVFATESTCKIGTTEYETITAAYAAATSGDTIVVTADTTISERITFAKSITITDDGNSHVITVANSETSTSYGRGLQTKAGYTLTIKATSKGNLTLDGTGNAGVGIMAFAGTLVLDKLTIQNFTNSMTGSQTKYGGAVSIGYQGNTSKVTATITDCSFASNSAADNCGSDIYVAHSNATLNMSGCDATDFYMNDGTTTISECDIVDVYMNEGTAAISDSNVSDAYLYAGSLTFGGTTNISTFTTTKAFSVDDTFTDSSLIYVSFVDTTAWSIGDTLVNGTSSTTCKAFKLVNFEGTVGSSGVIEIRYVCKIGNTPYTTLANALAKVNSVSSTSTVTTITLIDDAYITEQFNVKKGCKITDDGNPHTIYVYNQTESEDNAPKGRGIYKSGSATTLTIEATTKGNITIKGHNFDKTLYNVGPVIYAYNSSIILTRVIVEECVRSAVGGTIYGGSDSTITLNNSVIKNNQSTKGAAYYGSTDAILNVCNGTEITDNVTTSKDPTVGAICFLGETGTVRLSGQIYINNNTTATETEKDITLANSSQLSVTSNLTGLVGIDYTDADVDDGVIGSSTNAKYKVTALFSNGNSKLKAKVNSSKQIIWSKYKYDITFGDATKDGLTYSFANPTVTLSDDSIAASISVNNGSFAIDWSKLSDVATVIGIDEDYEYSSTKASPTETVNYRAVSIVFSTEKTQTDMATLLEAVTFTVAGQGVEQTTSVGFAQELPNNTVFFGAGIYGHEDDTYTWSRAESNAYTVEAEVATIDDLNTQLILQNAFEGGGWIGAIQTSSAWYWKGTTLDGVKIAGSATSSQGYDGAFVNWAEGSPATGDRAYMNADGTWSSYDGTSEKTGYYYEESVQTPVSTTTKVTNTTKTILTSMEMSFDGDIAMIYSFAFDPTTLADTSGTITVNVGEGSDAFTETSTIAEMLANGDGETVGVIKVALPAKMMGTKIGFVQKDSNGVQKRVFGNFDGEQVGKDYNPVYYANYMFDAELDRYNDNYSEDLKVMVAKMLNYGAAAQQQFDYDTENLVNANLASKYSDATAAMSSIPEEDVLAPTGSSKFTTAELIADSQTIMRLTYNGTASNVTVKFDGIETTNFTASSNTIDIPICAQNLNAVCVVTVGTETLQLNANYVLDVILQGTSYTSAQKLTADRLYKFGASANTYFGAYTQSQTAAEAVLDIAYAFLNKEDNSQYDMNSIACAEVSGVSYSRRNMMAEIENMTDYNSEYLDCSSFCWNVYRLAFSEGTNYSNVINAFVGNDGDDINDIRTSMIIDDGNDSTVIASWNTGVPYNWYEKSETVQEEYVETWNNIIEQAKAIMQPGDCLVYNGYKNNGDFGGHIVLWTGNGFIHCTGSSYKSSTQTDYYESLGSVHYIPQAQFTASYLKGHGAQTVKVIRPLNVLSESDLTDYAIARTQLSSLGISATGYDTSSSTALYDGQSVANGDTVVYSIKLDNKALTGNMTTTKTVDVTFNIPTYSTFTSATNSGSYSDGTVTWKNVTVAADEEVELQVNVSVSGSTGGLFSADGTVSLSEAGSSAKEITFAPETVEIEEALSTTVLNNVQGLTSSYSNYAESGVDGLAIVNQILKDCGLPTLDAENNEDLRDTYLYANGSYFRSALNSSSWHDQLVSNFIGGYYLYTGRMQGDFSHQNRLRNLTENNLKVGDVLMSYRSSDSKYDYYIYLGNNQCMCISYDLKTSIVNFNKFSGNKDVGGLWTLFMQRTACVVLRTGGRS